MAHGFFILKITRSSFQTVDKASSVHICEGDMQWIHILGLFCLSYFHAISANVRCLLLNIVHAQLWRKFCLVSLRFLKESKDIRVRVRVNSNVV